MAGGGGWRAGARARGRRQLRGLAPRGGVFHRRRPADAVLRFLPNHDEQHAVGGFIPDDEPAAAGGFVPDHDEQHAVGGFVPSRDEQHVVSGFVPDDEPAAVGGFVPDRDEQHAVGGFVPDDEPAAVGGFVPDHDEQAAVGGFVSNSEQHHLSPGLVRAGEDHDSVAYFPDSEEHKLAGIFVPDTEDQLLFGGIVPETQEELLYGAVPHSEEQVQQVQDAEMGGGEALLVNDDPVGAQELDDVDEQEGRQAGGQIAARADDVLAQVISLFGIQVVLQMMGS